MLRLLVDIFLIVFMIIRIKSLLLISYLQILCFWTIASNVMSIYLFAKIIIYSADSIEIFQFKFPIFLEAHHSRHYVTI